MSAGEKISGFQNGLAIAGDYMSGKPSFLGYLVGLVFLSGFDGLIYSNGILDGQLFFF